MEELRCFRLILRLRETILSTDREICHYHLIR